MGQLEMHPWGLALLSSLQVTPPGVLAALISQPDSRPYVMSYGTAYYRLQTLPWAPLLFLIVPGTKSPLTKGIGFVTVMSRSLDSSQSREGTSLQGGNWRLTGAPGTRHGARGLHSWNSPSSLTAGFRLSFPLYRWGN